LNASNFGLATNYLLGKSTMLNLFRRKRPAPKSSNQWRYFKPRFERLEERTVLSPVAFPLFNTGVDANGAPLAGASADPHWTVGGSNAVVLLNQSPSDGGFALNYAQSPQSRWIWLNAQGDAGGLVPVTFRLTFDLSGFDSDTAEITGSWAVDNVGEIKLNGVTTGHSLPTPVLGNFRSFHAFTIDTGFVAGINTLDFVVRNTADNGPTGPAGLNITNLVGMVGPSANIEIQDFQQNATDFVKVATLISEPKVLNKDGTPSLKFNKLDNDRFNIVIDDASIATSQVVVNQIELQSIGRDGATVLDSLSKLRLNRQKGGRFASQALILVADDQDDAFGGNEGTENDVTIKAEAGGKLKIKYKNAAGKITEKEIDVTRPADLRKIVLNVKFLVGLNYSPAGITGLINDASRLFSQINTYLEIKSITGVNDPGGLADLDEFTSLLMTAEERQLLAIGNDVDPTVVDVYFVRSLVSASTVRNTAEAFPPGVFTDPADAPFTGSLVLSQSSNHKTLGHELLHLLFDRGGHDPDRRRLIFSDLESAANLFSKRILRSEGATVAGSTFMQAKQSVGADRHGGLFAYLDLAPSTLISRPSATTGAMLKFTHFMTFPIPSERGLVSHSVIDRGHLGSFNAREPGYSDVNPSSSRRNETTEAIELEDIRLLHIYTQLTDHLSADGEDAVRERRQQVDADAVDILLSDAGFGDRSQAEGI
jgi:hypothetical protein